MHHFYPDYCLFEYAPSGLQNTEDAKITRNGYVQKCSRLKRFNGYKIPVIAPFLISNTSAVFICAIHNFDLDYCLLGFASSGLQNTKYAKITRNFDFFFHKVGKGPLKKMVVPTRPQFCEFRFKTSPSYSPYIYSHTFFFLI